MKRLLLAAGTGALLGLGSADAHAECRTFNEGEAVATLEAEIDESSGLAASSKNDGIFWTHNDSGGSARLFALGVDGVTRTVVTLPGVTARDWEGMALGPCAPDDPSPCLWVGDIGDNDRVRDDIRIHRFPEPTLGDAPALDATDVRTIHVSYEDGESHNAETLMVHPKDGRVFIVDKTPGDPSNLWLVPTDTDQVVATKVASASLGEIGVIGGRITGGGFAPSGEEFSIRTYALVYTFCGDPVEAFTASRPSRVIGYDLFQSEALAYSRDGDELWTTSEASPSRPPPLVRMDVVPPDDDDDPKDVGTSDDAETAVPAVDAAESPEVSVGPVDEGAGSEKGASCSCSTTKRAGSAGGASLLLGVLLGFSTTRRRHQAAAS